MPSLLASQLGSDDLPHCQKVEEKEKEITRENYKIVFNLFRILLRSNITALWRVVKLALYDARYRPACCPWPSAPAGPHIWTSAGAQDTSEN